MQHLPTEIISIISLDLTHSDLLQCQITSRKWHSIFERYSYDTLNAAAPSFPHALNRIRKAARTYNPLGFHVRHLKLSDGDLTLKQLNELRSLCPFLRGLTFRWIDTKKHQQRVKRMKNPQESSKEDNRKRLFGTPSFLLTTFTGLVHLTLDCDISSTTSSSVLLYLEHAANIQNLTINNMPTVLCPGEFDIIHDHCPHLQELTIRAPQDYRNFQWECLDRDSLRSSSPPALHIRSISIVYWSQLLTPHLFRYFATKYPNLKTLSLSISRRRIGLHDDEMNEATRAFGESCKQLERIELNDVMLDHTDLQNIFTGNSNLKEVVVRHRQLRVLDLASFRTLVGAVNSSVQYLDLVIPQETVKSDAFWDMTPFSALKELRLAVAIDLELCPLDIDQLLCLCPHITNLSLAGFELHAQNEMAREPHPLRMLRIGHSRLDQSFSSFLGGACTRLRHVTLSNCQGGRLLPWSSTCFDLSLPDCALDTLKIHNQQGRNVDFWTSHPDYAVQVVSIAIGDNHASDECKLYDDSVLICPMPVEKRQTGYHDDDYDPYEQPPYKSLKRKLTKEHMAVLRQFGEMGNGRSQQGLADLQPDTSALIERLHQNGHMAIRCKSIRKLVVNGVDLLQQ